jgi:hypothetical protein
MGKFTQYLGKLEVEVDGQKLELDAKLKDKEKLMKMQESKDSDKKVEVMTEVLLTIMERSYPNEPTEEVEAFVDKNYVEYLQNLMIAFKWAKQSDFDNLKKKEIAKIEN